jgi:hypothetical protein
LDDDPTLCHHDFFNVTAHSENKLAIHVKDECHMHDSLRIGMHMAEKTANDVAAFKDPSNNITTFLTKVAQSCRVTEPNVESWVSAVESKLANIGIFTIAEVIGMILTLTLFQAGHVPMYFCTLGLMAQEALCMKTITGLSMAAKDAKMMDLPLKVTASGNITRDNLELWVSKVPTKLHRIDIDNVQEAVSSILMVNCYTELDSP